MQIEGLAPSTKAGGKVSDDPHLTVRSMADMLRLPAHAQSRILSEQKNPKTAPNSFKTPYYAKALAGLRQYYEASNDLRALTAARSKIEGIGQQSKRQNNLRVLDKFQAHPIASRAFVPGANTRHTALVGSVLVKLSPDLQCQEDGKPRIIYFHSRGEKLDDEVARTTIEIAHWVLEENGIALDVTQIEFADLFSGKIHQTKKRRSQTIKQMKENARIIEVLWPTLD